MRAHTHTACAHTLPHSHTATISHLCVSHWREQGDDWQPRQSADGRQHSPGILESRDRRCVCVSVCVSVCVCVCVSVCVCIYNFQLRAGLYIDHNCSTSLDTCINTYLFLIFKYNCRNSCLISFEWNKLKSIYLIWAEYFKSHRNHKMSDT